MAIRLVRSHRQTRIQEQDAAVRPRGEQASFLGRRFEAVGIFDFEELIDVCEGWRGGGGRTDGEAEAMCLVETVVRILAQDHAFDGV